MVSHQPVAAPVQCPSRYGACPIFPNCPKVSPMCKQGTQTLYVHVCFSLRYVKYYSNQNFRKEGSSHLFLSTYDVFFPLTNPLSFLGQLFAQAIPIFIQNYYESCLDSKVSSKNFPQICFFPSIISTSDPVFCFFGYIVLLLKREFTIPHIGGGWVVIYSHSF